MSKFHYVYRITNTIENKHYYGVRTSKVEPKLDLGFKYFSSSTDKEFIQEQKENKFIFKYKIIKQFDSREDANMYEHNLHEKFQVHTNTNFYNLAISRGCEKFAMPGTVYAKDLKTGKYSRVLKHTYMNSDNLVTDMHNMRNYRDLETGIVSRISVHEINLNPDRYVPADKNMVTVKSIIDNTTIKVTYNEFETNKFLVGPRTKYFYCYDNNAYRRNDINRLKIDISKCYTITKELYIRLLHCEITVDELASSDLKDTYINKIRVIEKSTCKVIKIPHNQFDTTLHSKKIKQVKTINLINNIIERVSLYEYYKRKELLQLNSSRLYITASNDYVRRVDVIEDSITTKNYVKINDCVLTLYVNYLNFSSLNNDI